MKYTVAGFVIAVLALSGCQSSNSVIGKWKVVPYKGTAPMAIEMEFIAPDDMKTVLHPAPGQVIKIVGKFRQDGRMFMSVAQDAKAEYSGTGAAQAEQEFAMTKSMYLSEANQDGKGVISWDGPDKFFFTPERMAEPFTVFTRIK